MNRTLAACRHLTLPIIISTDTITTTVSYYLPFLFKQPILPENTPKVSPKKEPVEITGVRFYTGWMILSPHLKALKAYNTSVIYSVMQN